MGADGKVNSKAALFQIPHGPFEQARRGSGRCGAPRSSASVARGDGVGGAKRTGVCPVEFYSRLSTIIEGKNT